MLQRTRFSLIVLGLLAAPVVASAAPGETVVHNTWTWVDIDLNPETVLCSAADYGSLFLKIGMPELARITLLDHQNVGAGAPCVQAGVCAPGHMPETIIDPAHPTEHVHINVKAVRYDEPDEAAHTCTTTLIERVKLTVRGIKFTHERQAALGSRRYEDCVTAAQAGKADESDPEPDQKSDPANAGCSATNSSGSSLALVAVGMLALRRRRKPNTQRG